MVSGDDRGEEVAGTNPAQPTMVTSVDPDASLIVASEVADPLEIPLLDDPVDTDDEKAHRDAGFLYCNPHSLGLIPGCLPGSSNHCPEGFTKIYSH